MVEFLAGLVAVLALLAGLRQAISLTRAHTDALAAARRQAGERALFDPGQGMDLLGDADYIRDRHPGPDGKRHTRDDWAAAGDAAAFSARLVEPTCRNAAAWELLGAAPGDRVTALRGHPAPGAVLGLVRGDAAESVPLLPAVRSLLYRADRIDIESRVWMTRMEGIY